MISTFPQCVLGHLPQLRRYPLEFLEQIKREQGEVARFRAGPVPVVLVNDPKLALEVLSARAAEFPKGRARPASRVLFGNGLLNSDGERWREQRTLTSTALRESTSDATTLIEKLTVELITRWHESGARDVYQDFLHLSLRLACNVLFGREPNDLYEHISAALDELNSQFVTMPISSLVLPMWVPTRANVRSRRAAKRVHRAISELISAASNGASGGAWLRLVRSDPASREDWLYQATALLMAAHETTALALTWTLWLLATHPQEQERLRSERVAPNGGTMTALECVIQESLRLFPPVYAIGREAASNVMIGGHSIKRGTSVFVSQWLLHRDERTFSNACAFHPERWRTDIATPGSYLAFGAGPRACVGRYLAQQMLRHVLSSVLKNFSVATEEIEIAPRASLTLQPAKPLCLSIRSDSGHPVHGRGLSR